MKNLLIYTGSRKMFSEEDATMARIQIDNSLDLGWKREDILLVTDFPYEYNGVRSLVIPEDLYYDFDKNANKAIVIVHLLNQGVIDPQKLYWCHDFDVFENHVIHEEELGLADFELGLTHYSYKPEWQFGSLFFKDSSRDIFELLDRTIRANPYSGRNNEKTLTVLIRDGAIEPSRYKRLNVTYNFTKRYIQTVYQEAQKPLRVLHFRPSNKDALMSHTALEMFMYGKNRLKIPLMSERLIKTFHHHGVK